MFPHSKILIFVLTTALLCFILLESRANVLMFVRFVGVTYPVRFTKRVLRLGSYDVVFLEALTLRLLCCRTSHAKAKA